MSLIPYTLIPHKRYDLQYFLSETCPGTLQYRVDPERYKLIEFPSSSVVSSIDGGFVGIEPTEEKLQQVLPDTVTGKKLAQNCKVLFMIQWKQEDETCIKAAIQNTVTGQIALMTGISVKDYTDSRTMKSHHPKFRVCQCRMTAPLLFWMKLKDCLVE